MFSPLDAADKLALRRGVAALAAIAFVAVAQPAVEKIVAVMTYEGVVTLHSLKNVVAPEAQQGVVASSAYQHVVVDATQDDIPAIEAVDDCQGVVFFGNGVAAEEDVVALVAGKKIAAFLTDKQVIGLIPPEEVIAGTAYELVNSFSAQQIIVARSPDNQVIAGAGTQDVVAALAVNAVVASTAEDNVVAVSADQDIVSGPPYQGGNGAQSINVLLLVYVVLGCAGIRFKIVVQPVPRRNFMLREVGPGQRLGPGLGRAGAEAERCREQYNLGPRQQCQGPESEAVKPKKCHISVMLVERFSSRQEFEKGIPEFEWYHTSNLDKASGGAEISCRRQIPAHADCARIRVS